MSAATKPQLEVLQYIKEYIEENGFPPSRKDIAKHFAIYENAVQDFLKRLEKNGCIEITKNVARGIRVTSHDAEQ